MKILKQKFIFRYTGAITSGNTKHFPEHHYCLLKEEVKDCVVKSHRTQIQYRRPSIFPQTLGVVRRDDACNGREREREKENKIY